MIRSCWKRPPRDANELAKYIVDVTSGEAKKIEPPRKDPAAVALGRRGGQASAKTRIKDSPLPNSPLPNAALLPKRPPKLAGIKHPNPNSNFSQRTRLVSV